MDVASIYLKQRPNGRRLDLFETTPSFGDMSIVEQGKLFREVCDQCIQINVEAIIEDIDNFLLIVFNIISGNLE